MVRREFKERWKPVMFTNGKYKVSNHGRVMSVYSLSCQCKIRLTGTILKHQIHHNGYPIIGITWMAEGVRKKKKIFVHRLVGEAFVPNTQGKPQINHKNGVKDDNYYENLEWVTNLENTHHAQRIGLKPIAKPVERRPRKIPPKKAKEIVDIITGEKYISVTLATLLNTNRKEVCRMINGERGPNISPYRYTGRIVNQSEYL